MMWLLLIPLAAVVAWLWWPRPAPRSPFPPVTDTVAGFADRTRGDRLTAPFDWDADGDDAA